MKIPSQLQASIEALHDVETGLDVRDFIIDDSVREGIPGARQGIPEQLFIRETPEAVDLALYIAPDVVAQLEADPPSQRLHGGNLEAYCIALEGVSHFVLYTWRAVQTLQVSALELELQAEVDKFVTAWLLLAEQGAPRDTAAAQLKKQLFERYELRPELEPEEASRYHTATKAAASYCERLVKRYARDPEPRRIYADVRGYYRRGLLEKLRAA